MKKTIVFVSIVFCLSLFFLSCNKTRAKTLDRLLNTESGDYSNDKISKKRINELEEGIKEYSKDVERVVKANAEIGVYYRMIALEYLDLKMYKLALENFEKSIEYYPSNPVLNYYAGLTEANIARSETSVIKSASLFKKAENYYIAALRLKSTYSDAMYALSVLYLFDLDKPDKAKPLLEKMLSLNPKNWEAMSLFARYKVLTGDIDGAIDFYTTISEDAWDDSMKEQAAENRDSLLAGRL